MTKTCIDCEDRDAVPHQRRCQACLQARQVHLSEAERSRLLDILRSMIDQADDVFDELHAERLVVDLAGVVAILDHPPGQRRGRTLRGVAKDIAAGVVEGAAIGYELAYGDVDPELEQLFRRITRTDRRTGLPPPWLPVNPKLD